jgi:cytochrome c
MSALLTVQPLAAQDLQGHGGPVRALVAGADGVIYSGSFDTRSIVWVGTTARQITRYHTGAVTAVLPLPDGRFATGGQDGRVAIWGAGPEPLSAETLHPMPVGALALFGSGVASAGWDGRIALWDSKTLPRYIDAHEGQISGLVAYRDGLASVGADLRLRIWRPDGTPGPQYDLAEPASALATDGEALFLVSASGTLRKVTDDGTVREVAITQRPLLSITAEPGFVAVGGVAGEVWQIDADTLEARVKMDTGQGPIWALAVSGGVLLTGGNDGLIRRWTREGAPLGEGGGIADPTLVNPRGAQVFRACAVCHTLTPDDGARAGPTLHGIFGRPIASAEGFQYSDALEQLDIVWTAQTISELFEFGPEAYTPDSRMPEQRVPGAEDRRALIEFLEVATR